MKNKENEANEKTENSRQEAEQECWEHWHDAFKDAKYNGSTTVFLEQVRQCLVQAARLAAEDRSPALDRIFKRRLGLVLATSFRYDYTLYEWNGQDFTEEPLSDELDDAAQAMWIVDALEEFLLTAATRAKAIGSDTYATWRKAIADLNYHFDRFEDGAEEEQVKEFVDAIASAAQLLWVDACVQKRLSPPDLSPKGVKGKKGRKSQR